MDGPCKKRHQLGEPFCCFPRVCTAMMSELMTSSSLHTGRRRRAGEATRTAGPQRRAGGQAVGPGSPICGALPVAQKFRCRAALPAPVSLAGLPARTRHPSRLARHQPAGDGPGRQALHRQHSIRGSCLDSSVLAHGATARPPGHRCRRTTLFAFLLEFCETHRQLA